MLVGHCFGGCLAARNAGIVDEDVDLPMARDQLVGDLRDTA